MPSEPVTLLAVGAGPKTVAVAAKAAAAARLGLRVPRIVAVEQRAVGGNWLPGGGWTDGRQRLGTSPEKDVGFPYRSDLLPGGGRALDRAMADYSWTNHLIELGTYADWVDRGRPQPRHRDWARYLQWAATKAALVVVAGRVDVISSDARGWVLTVVTAGGATRTLTGDALLVTGPGPARSRLLVGDPAVLDLPRFWSMAAERRLPAVTRAAVIGGGESAASVLDELARHDAQSILVVSPGPTLYTRGESYFENRMYSDPTSWTSLSVRQRRELIGRTDRGVFSARVQEDLRFDDRVRHVPGRVVGAARDGGSIVLTTTAERRPDQAVRADLVVDATGERPMWFTELFDQAASDALELAVGWPVTRERVEEAIGPDLAVRGMRPRLHLPALAGPACGPGFPNLSCLGLLSDRVLSGLSGLVGQDAGAAFDSAALDTGGPGAAGVPAGIGVRPAPSRGA